MLCGALCGALCGGAQGGPVAVEQLGRIDLGGLYGNERAMDACVKAYCLYLEAHWQAVRRGSAGGTRKSQALIVIDVTGLARAAPPHRLPRDPTWRASGPRVGTHGADPAVGVGWRVARRR